MTDWELLKRYAETKAGDAFSELARRHVDMVYHTALRALKDAELAEDVTQSVFMVLMAKAGKLSPKVVIGGWLFQVTQYAVRDAQRKRFRRQRHEQEAGRMRLETKKNVEPVEIGLALDNAIAKLSKADQSGIVLKYLEGRSYAEVAMALGTTEEGARKRLSRAVMKLREMLQKGGVSAGEAALGAAFAAHSAASAPLSVLTHIQTLASGSSGSSASAVLAKEVLHMMKIQKIKMVSGIVAAAVLLSSGVALTLVETNWAAGAETSTPAATEAAPKTAIAETPKDVVIHAFHLALEGDADKFVSCFASLTPDQETAMRNYVSAASAYNVIMTAVEKKFGKEARAKFEQQLLGVNPIDVEKATEIVDGDSATVDMGTSGPGKVPMVRVGGVWKISPEVLKTFSSPMAAAMKGKVASFRKLAADIDAGTFTDTEQVGEKLGHIMQEGPPTTDTP